MFCSSQRLVLSFFLFFLLLFFFSSSVFVFFLKKKKLDQLLHLFSKDVVRPLLAHGIINSCAVGTSAVYRLLSKVLHTCPKIGKDFLDLCFNMLPMVSNGCWSLRGVQEFFALMVKATSRSNAEKVCPAATLKRVWEGEREKKPSHSSFARFSPFFSFFTCQTVYFFYEGPAWADP
jgi:hypothetical protein